MLKLLIVEDEPNVRDGLYHSIDWNGLGAEVVGAAGDGITAAAMVNELLPDVVLSDIRMPGWDGLELAAWIREAHPGTAVIFLTGYKEFDYAKTALELEATDYLLKPVEEDDLKKILDKLVSRKECELDRQSQYEKASRMLEEHLPALREKFMLDLLKGATPLDRIWDSLEFYDLNIVAARYCISVTEYCVLRDTTRPDTGSMELEGLRLKGILGDTLVGDCKAFVFGGGGNRIVAVVGFDEGGCGDYVYDCFLSKMDVFRCAAFTGDLAVTIGVSDIHEGIQSLPRCWFEAEESLSSKAYIGRNAVISYRGLNKDVCGSIRRIDQEKFQLALLSGEEEEIKRWLECYFDSYRESGRIRAMQLGFIACELAAELIDLSWKEGCADKATVGWGTVDRLARMETLNDLQAEAEVICLDVARMLRQYRKRRFSKTVSEMLDYMETHFTSPDLDLKTMAARFYMNPFYMSKIFSMETGRTFTDHLTSLRIERAKGMLAGTDETVYVISEDVGYTGQKYFSKLFKKIVGISPIEYRTRFSPGRKTT